MNLLQDELDTISDPLHVFLKDTKARDKNKPVSNTDFDLNLAQFWKPLKKRFHGVKAAGVQRHVRSSLNTLKGFIGFKQFGLTADRNLWIVKPGAMSRGRHIQIHHDLDELCRCLTVSSMRCWVTQKYIERPLIILGKKFDIRQWVLITSVRPLTIWLWMTPYLRFTAQDYNPA